MLNEKEGEVTVVGTILPTRLFFGFTEAKAGTLGPFFVKKTIIMIEMCFY